jgi:hypothetical protein
MVAISILLLLLTSCSVCRHEVMTAAAMTEEWKKPYKIVVYEVDDPYWAGHAQVRLDDGRWVCSMMGMYWICDSPFVKPTGRSKSFSAPEWLDVLKAGQFKW